MKHMPRDDQRLVHLELERGDMQHPHHTHSRTDRLDHGVRRRQLAFRGGVSIRCTKREPIGPTKKRTLSEKAMKGIIFVDGGYEILDW